MISATPLSSGLPDWIKTTGNGDGYGYGYGYGYGNGDGYGYGNGDGYGNGYGNGNGYGDGDGDGNGYGNGNGNGYGYGYGYGYGNGNGYGNGDGNGYGDGYGDGDGNGYGYGNGYGDKAYWLATVSCFSEKWEPAQRDRLAELLASGATVAFWKSDAAGGASNGGSCAPVQPGTIHEERGPLRDDCGRGQLHATLLPPKWNGERMWIVAFHGEVRHGDDKLWGLKREIVGECL